MNASAIRMLRPVVHARVLAFRRSILDAESYRVQIAFVSLLVVLAVTVRPGHSAQSLIIDCLLVGVFAYAWNLVGGLLGEISLAHAVYWGIGAYSFVLGTNSGWSLAMCIATAFCVAGVAGVVTVLFAIAAKLDSFYWMIATLMLVSVATAVATEVDALGRAEGLIVTAPLPLGSDDFIPALTIAFAVTFLVNGLLVRSRRGKRWIAHRDEPLAARVIGVRSSRERMLAYALSGALTGVGGCLAGAMIGFASPSVSLSIAPVVTAILVVYVGGPGTVFGPLMGLLLLQGLNECFTRLLGGDSPQAAHVAQYLAALIVVRLAFQRSDRVPRAMSTDEPVPELADVLVEVGAQKPVKTDPVVLELVGVRKSFGGLKVLEEVTFSVRGGEVVGLVGPNGAGKTTLLNIINGLLELDSGQIKINGQELRRPQAAELAHDGFVRTFQTPRVFESLSMHDSISITPRVSRTSAAAALERFGLPLRLRGRAASLTQRKQLEQARIEATTGVARVVLLDEPLSGLDLGEMEHILRTARRAADSGSAVIVVEHLIPVIAPLCDRMVVLAGGRVLVDGDPDHVLKDPRVVEAYLGATAEVEEVVDNV